MIANWGSTYPGGSGFYGGGIGGGGVGMALAFTSGVNKKGTLQSLAQSIGNNANENADGATANNGQDGYNSNYEGKTGDKGDKGDHKGPAGPGDDMENENKDNGSLSQKQEKQQNINKVEQLKSDISFDKVMIENSLTQAKEKGTELTKEDIKTGGLGSELGGIGNYIIYTIKLRNDSEELKRIQGR